MKHKMFWLGSALLLGLAFLAVAIAQIDPAYEPWGAASTTSTAWMPLTGDVNLDGNVNVTDVVALRNMRKYNYVGDVNGDLKVNDLDEIYLSNYVLKGGPAPVPHTRCHDIRVEDVCAYEGQPVK